MDDEIESVLYIIREINGNVAVYVSFSYIILTVSLAVHKIPPLKTNEGHRAAEWGDLAKPLWKGRMRIIEKSSGVSILFEDPTTGMFPCPDMREALAESIKHRRTYAFPMMIFVGTLHYFAVFAQAVYDPLKPSVDAVLDSSRYFSVRIEDNGRKAYIGIGFAERTDSFDFSEL